MPGARAFQSAQVDPPGPLPVEEFARGRGNRASAPIECTASPHTQAPCPQIVRSLYLHIAISGIDVGQTAVVEMIQRKRAGLPVPIERIAAPAPNVVRRYSRRSCLLQ